MAIKTHVRGQLFGYKELPVESGLWGVLLPRPGEKAVAHEPDAPDVIQQIDEVQLVFGNSERAGNRGFLFAFFVPMTLILLSWVLGFMQLTPHASTTKLVMVSLYLFFGTIAGIFGAIAFWAARSLLPPPVLISRKLRKVYFWHQQAKAWVALDYDRLTPTTFVHRAVTTSGAFTVYVLILCQLKAGSREIEFSTAPAPAQSTPQACGQLWEFIRRYMDGAPSALPGVRLLPAQADKRNWMARADREVLINQVDDQHKVERRLIAMYLVWWYGIFFYWPERARNWIERTAPRRALPPELQAADGGVGPSNPYRIVPPSSIEQEAQAGTLLYMRRRWFICGVVSTLFWGGVFGLLAASIWLMG